MQVEKVQIGTDFVYQNPCHKENCVNVCPFWVQTAPRNPLAYDPALSGIRRLPHPFQKRGFLAHRAVRGACP